MGNISFGNKQFEVSKKHEEHILVCEEMSAYYGQKLYWLPYKFPIQRVKDVYLEQKKNGDRNFTHLMQKLHH